MLVDLPQLLLLLQRIKLQHFQLHEFGEEEGLYERTSTKMDLLDLWIA